MVSRPGSQTACRLYVLTAAKAPLALVLRRGPTNWWHLLQWDLDRLTLTPGAWFHGTLYPRRCDISADGRLFGYFASKRGRPYFAVARTPWLEALQLWETLGTWTWGCRFDESGDLEVRACLNSCQPGTYPGGSISVGPMSTDWPKRDVWNELKRGWEIAAEDGPAAGLALRRPQPGGSLSLGLIHGGVDFKRPGMEGVQLEYFLQDHPHDQPHDVTALPDAVWADWDRHGRLLMATRDGRLEIGNCRGTILEPVWSEDLGQRTPDPQPAPGWAGRWR